MTSISHVVKEIISSDPSLLQCILNDIVNYTKLSRKLKPLINDVAGYDVGVDTIKIALIRFADKALKEFNMLKKNVIQILARSSIEIKTGVTVITVRNTEFLKIVQHIPFLLSKSRFVAIMQSVMVTTLVLDNETAEEVMSKLNKDEIISIQKDYAAIVIVSPVEIMNTPGVLSYITNVLALNGVNIVHIESCYTDTVIVVSKTELVKAFQVLSRHIEASKKLINTSNQSTL